MARRTLPFISAIIVFLVQLKMLSLVMSVSPPDINIDMHALLALKARITLDPSNFLANNWSVSTSMCSWVGVTCNSRHHRVAALNISNMDLTGIIPPQLGNLSFLAVLDIEKNKFCGFLPVELTQLRRLKYISLAFNNFSNEIPSWFGSLPKLQNLRLHSNSFLGNIPPSLGNISSLKSLFLGHNQLSGAIPKQIWKLTNLESLSLHHNSIQGVIPKEIRNLTKLRELFINGNGLQGEISQELGYLKVLERLNIGDNHLSGTISKQIGNLTKLKQLHSGYNFLQGDIPNELGNLGNMEALTLGFNNLTGSIPTTLFNISTMKQLSLQDNKLYGSLPTDLNFGLPNLEQLQLWGNNLSGTIPSFITNASKLYLLELEGNSFTGFIPNTIGNLRNLKWLDVRDNHLRSSTPDLSFLASLANCKSLVELQLSGNPLNGVLPGFIGNLSVSLTQFDASDCNIRGRIPQEIGHLKNLMLLNLGENELSGPIPVTFGELHNLQSLSLGENKLEGSIPRELCRLDRLYELYLQDNKLFGSIPTCLGDVNSLRHLFLSSNLLRSIPSSLWNLRDILVFDLSSNSLSGPLPLEIGNLKVATTIDLSRNHLSGNIPATIVGLDNLKNLSLGSNRLHGPIPESVGDMIALESLDLSYNNLSGDIPQSMEKLRSLSSLNLSFNKLEGRIPSTGAFRNILGKSFMGNLALCGSPQQGVPPCKFVSHKKTKMTYILLSTILPLTVVILTFVLVSIRFMGRSKRSKRLRQDDEVSTWRRFSYHDLLQATDGFSDSNLLGSGSFGSVYEGRFHDGTKIAVKVFHPEFEEAIKSFDVECKVMSNIRHRNLVKIISSCSNDDYKALVLEYMSNGNLDKWLYSHNFFLDILQRLNIMIDVAYALEYLHFDYSSHIVHCDLKPKNVLLDEDMVAHLSDFGLAKLLGNGESMRQTQILATIGYMAPEYGREGKVSRKCDVYSYGIMLMEIFTRKNPTDESFTEEMSLKCWVSDSLHNSVMEVVDANLLRRDDEHFYAKEECVSSVLSLAIECTHEVPAMRIDMRKVVSKLVKIRAILVAKIGQTHQAKRI